MAISELVTNGQKCDRLIALIQADPDFAAITAHYPSLTIHPVDTSGVDQEAGLAVCIDIAGSNPANAFGDAGTLGPSGIGSDVKTVRLGLIVYAYATNRDDADPNYGTKKRLCTNISDRLVDIARHYYDDPTPGDSLWDRSEFFPHWSTLSTTYQYDTSNHKGLTALDLYSEVTRT